VKTLQLSGITASHQGTPVLHGIDLTVPSGTTTAVLGPSGCGKTTLLRVVAGFLRPDAGQVRVGDEVVAGPGVWVAPERRGFGYVAQEGNLFPHLDVAANISYGLPRRERRAGARVAELLELVGLPGDFATRRPDQLSGGQQQRVGVARALAADPPIMLMDEPFGAVDPITRSRLQDEFLSLQQTLRKTIVFVTHDFDEALKIGDRIAVLRQGSQITQYDTPEAILAQPADDFVEGFIGEGAALKRLHFERVDSLELGEPDAQPTHDTVDVSSTLHAALDLMVGKGLSAVTVNRDGRPVGTVTTQSILDRAHTGDADAVEA
jgi:iron(III) transport system ATP-binding protein